MPELVTQRVPIGLLKTIDTRAFNDPAPTAAFAPALGAEG